MNDMMLMIIHALGTALLGFVWQGALLGLATAAALALLRNARPQTRYAVACAALSLCALLPILTFIANFTGDDDGAISDLAFGTLGDTVVSSSGLEILVAWLQAHVTTVVAAWAICVSMLGIRICFGLAWVARIYSVRDGTDNYRWQMRVNAFAEQLGVGRPISLRVMQNLNTPVTVGWWRPVIMVSAALISGMSPEFLEALLAHEVAHIRRFDYLVNLLQSVIEAGLFYHPAVWWISNRIRAERELIADDLAAGILGEPRRLALALHELAYIQFSTNHMALAAHGGNFMVRIKRLIHPEVQPLDWKAAIPAVTLVIAGLALYANSALADIAASAPATVGKSHNSTAVLADLDTCKPVYPAESMSRSEEGTVTVSFKVDSHGHLTSSKVLKPSGHPLLDNAALTGLKACSFKAAMKNGKAVAATLNIDYVWKLGE